MGWDEAFRGDAVADAGPRGLGGAGRDGVRGGMSEYATRRNLDVCGRFTRTLEPRSGAERTLGYIYWLLPDIPTMRCYTDYSTCRAPRVGRVTHNSSLYFLVSDRISLRELDLSVSTVFCFLQTDTSDTVVRRTDARKICLFVFRLRLLLENRNGFQKSRRRSEVPNKIVNYPGLHFQFTRTTL